MINRQNYLDVRAYLRHCERGRQAAPNTVGRYRSSLRHLITWADASPLPQARRLDPPFPSYLLTARVDGQAKPLAPISIVKTLQLARQFLTFARAEWPHRYRALSRSWVETLQVPRQVRAESRLPVIQLYTLDEVQQIAAVAAETLREERGKVAACMLFLSGMRADALASLPIACVDLAARQISQLPERGVRTKNRKAALTYLLEIPALLDVVERWDSLVRATLPPSALWYATLTSDGMTPTATLVAHEGRNCLIDDDLHIICQRAGLPYKSAHKLRHGHVVHALKQAQNLTQLKSISQNVMHKSVTITDGVYGNLLTDDVKNTIARLGAETHTGDGLEAKIDELLKLLRRK